MSERPIISMMEGVKALMRESGPETSEAAKPLPMVPAQASSAAVAVGMLRLLPWARETNAAINVSEYESSRVSSLLPNGQSFMLRIVLGGLGTFGVGLARLVVAA